MVNRKEEQGSKAISDNKKEKEDAQVERKEAMQLRQPQGGEGGFLRPALLAGPSRLPHSVRRHQHQFYSEDADGIDRHFGVNYLGHYYVCN